MNKRIFLSFIIFLMGANIASAREIININKGWIIGKTLLKTEYNKKVDLPHSWDKAYIDKELGSIDGSVGYLREINIPIDWEQKSVFVRFKGVAGEATLFVNGKYIGSHNGAFTAFTFDISRNIKYGAKNSILLSVNPNTQIGAMPLGGIGVNFGGIYRDVEVIVTDKEHISVTHYSSNGVYITTKDINEDEALVSVDVMLNGNFGDKLKANVVVKDDQGTVNSVDGETTITQNGTGFISLSVPIKNPRLWDGFHDPFLYTAYVTLYDAKGVVCDKVNEEFGVRSVSIDRQKGFLLNGKEYPIYGVLLNQERPSRGYALTYDDMKNDISIVEEIGASAVRFANGAHDQYEYSLCDKKGILVWSDLPFYGNEVLGGVSFINSFDFKNSGIIQLKEMVWQLYNHPSIAFWGLFSNLAGSGDNPLEYLQELNEVAKLISPNRITVGVSNQDGEVNKVPDAISFSQYFGWRKGSVEDLNIWLNSFNKGWQSLKPALGEYGFGGDVYTFSDNNSGGKISDLKYSEMTQLQHHLKSANMLQNRPYIWGYFVNSLFDDPSSVEKDMGLVSADRNLKKDAFYLYKAFWNAGGEFIHIAGKRDIYRNSLRQDVIAISNLPSAELIVNGSIISTAQNIGGTIVWPSVKLKKGENIIIVRSGTQKDEIKMIVSKDI
ncbi:MAG: glycoside hydrolase family 2 TIM barrel-domain containing protein [Rikenellaceae bacterium]